MTKRESDTINKRLEAIEGDVRHLTELLEKQVGLLTQQGYRLQKEWYTVAEMAEITGINPRTIRARCAKGRYQTDAHTPGHSFRISYRHVLEHLESTGQSVEVAFKKLKKLKTA